MRKIIIVLIFLSIFSLTLAPSISAIEFNELIKTNKSVIIKEVKNQNLITFFQYMKSLIDKNLVNQFIDVFSAFGILSGVLGLIIGIIVRLAVLTISTILDICIALIPIVLYFTMRVAKTALIIASFVIVILEVMGIIQE
jgi:hypothetical protein